MIERAVLDFLDALGPELRRQAIFPFDSEERRNWHYIPKARRGVPLKAMTEAQRQAARALLRAALSERGYSRVEDIIWLENVLVQIGREPEELTVRWYVFSVSEIQPAEIPGDGGWTAIICRQFRAHVGRGCGDAAFSAHNPATVEHGDNAGLRLLAPRRI